MNLFLLEMRARIDEIDAIFIYNMRCAIVCVCGMGHLEGNRTTCNQNDKANGSEEEKNIYIILTHTNKHIFYRMYGMHAQTKRTILPVRWPAIT